MRRVIPGLVAMLASACGPESEEQEYDDTPARVIDTWMDAIEGCTVLSHTLQSCDPPLPDDAAMCLMACTRSQQEFGEVAGASMSEDDPDWDAALLCAQAAEAWTSCLAALTCETYGATCGAGTNPCAAESSSFDEACASAP